MMRIVNLDVLRSFRTPGFCDACGKYCRECCGHHVWPRSRGRIDHSFNLMKVGMDYFQDCKCHRIFEDMPRAEAIAMGMAILAKRDRTSVQAIEDLIPIILQLPKNAPQHMAALRLSELTGESHALASKVFCDLGLLET